jgi:hypothetical protein
MAAEIPLSQVDAGDVDTEGPPAAAIVADAMARVRVQPATTRVDSITEPAARRR